MCCTYLFSYKGCDGLQMLTNCVHTNEPRTRNILKYYLYP